MLDINDDNTTDGARRLHAGGQHIGLRRLVAPPVHRARLPRRFVLRELGRHAREGCFDLMFFDDRLAMPGIYGGSVAEAVKYGARPVKLDLSIVLGRARAGDVAIGLGATVSTTYYTPFHVARTFATLDHLPAVGRRGTSSPRSTTARRRTSASTTHLGHDARYDRAEEFLEAVVRAVGHLGGRRDPARPRDMASSPTRTRSTSSTTTASTSRFVAR